MMPPDAMPESEEQQNNVWPPPPSPVPNESREGPKHREEIKLFTGAAWADALLGSLVSLVSFTLLTFILFNPLAARVLPETWPSQFRLLSGWSFASVVQLVGGIFFRRRHYHSVSCSILWASISAAAFWLLIILAAWWMFG